MSLESSKENHKKAALLAEQWANQGQGKTVWLRFTEDWLNNPHQKITAGMTAQRERKLAALYVVCGRAELIGEPKKTEVEPDTGPGVEVRFTGSVATPRR